MKQIFIDVETTGLDPKKNGIIQISGIVVIDGKGKEVFDLKPGLFAEDIVDEKAMEVNKIDIEEVRRRLHPMAAFKQLEFLLSKWIDKFDKSDKAFFIGYNALFDYQFMREWFTKCGTKFFGSWFWTPPIDVMTIAGFFLQGERGSMENFKLGTVAEKMGIVVDKSRQHDSLYDVTLTVKIYEKLGRLAGWLI